MRVWILFLASRALACECAPPPPPCEAIGQSELVFLGTVTEVTARAHELKTAQMRVDRSFKGEVKGTIELFDNGMCDGPNLQIGRQYLMYTSGDPTKALPARGCTRSRAVEDAADDLAFLKQYSAGETITHVSGTVRLAPDGRAREEERTPLKDVAITLRGESGELRTTTNAAGSYAVRGLPSGSYNIAAVLPGYSVACSPWELKLLPKGCAQADILMTVDRRVSCLVRDREGAPAHGVKVELVSSKRGKKRWERPSFLGVTDKTGRYTIDGISPGEYYLGINIQSTPIRENPFPPTFYPMGSDISQATPITVAIGASVQEFNLQLPAALPVIKINGRLLMANGKPPLPEDHPAVRIKEPGLYGQIEHETIEIDSSGHFNLELCEGTRYSAFAFMGSNANSIHRAPVEFVPTKENNKLELILDKSDKEFQKLYRLMDR